MTEVVRSLSSPGNGDRRRPWWARLYYADGVVKTRRRIQVGGQLAIEVTNATKAGLWMDIDVGIKRADIGRIEWGGPQT